MKFKKKDLVSRRVFSSDVDSIMLHRYKKSWIISGLKNDYGLFYSDDLRTDQEMVDFLNENNFEFVYDVDIMFIPLGNPRKKSQNARIKRV